MPATSDAEVVHVWLSHAGSEHISSYHLDLLDVSVLTHFKNPWKRFQLAGIDVKEAGGLGLWIKHAHRTGCRL